MLMEIIFKGDTKISTYLISLVEIFEICQELISKDFQEKIKTVQINTSIRFSVLVWKQWGY